MTVNRYREIHDAHVAGVPLDLEPEEQLAYTQSVELLQQQAKDVADSVQQVFDHIKIEMGPWASFDPSRLLPSLPGLDSALDSLRDVIKDFPENWEDADVSYADILRAINCHNVPLAFVPRSWLVSQIVAAQSEAECKKLLLDHAHLILEDCQSELSKVDSSKVGFDTSLAASSIQAFQEGHFEAGAALAVLIIDTALGRVPQTGKRTQYVKIHKGFADRFPETTPLAQAPAWAAFYPIQTLYRAWARSELLLEGPSRHQVVHYAVPECYKQEDCVLIAMSLVSILRGLTLYPNALHEAWVAGNKPS